MNRYFVSVWMGVAIMALGLAGCAGQSAKKDEQLVKKTCDNWAAALVAKDVDQFAQTLSPNFKASQAEDRDALVNFIKEAIDSGYLDDAKISFEESQYTLTEGKYTVYPVDLSSSAGSVAAELTLSKEEGKWLITSMEVDGL